MMNSSTDSRKFRGVKEQELREKRTIQYLNCDLKELKSQAKRSDTEDRA